jgi:hypothetical protein
VTLRAAAALLLAMGCASPGWRPVPGTPPLGILGDPEDVAGQGLARGAGGALARPCLERVVGSAGDGRPHVELRRLRGVDPIEPGADALAQRARTAVGEAAHGRAVAEPEVLLVSALAPGQRVTVDEPALRLRPEAREALATGAEAFFRLCGTDAILSTDHDAETHLAIGQAWTTDEEAVAAERALHAALGGDPDDVRRLRVLSALPPGGPAVSVFHAETRDPVEPLLAQRGDASLAELVARALGATAASGRGRVTAAEVRPWSEVASGRLVEGLDPDRLGGGGEAVARALQDLREAARGADRRLHQALALGGDQGKACAARAGALAPAWRGRSLDACAAAARAGGGAVGLLSDCAAIVGAIERVEADPDCLAVRSRASGLADPLLRDETFRPLRLVAADRGGWFPEPEEAAPARIPGAASPSGPAPGDGAAADGEGGFWRCAAISPDTGGPPALRRVRAFSTTEGLRRPPWWERLLFWRPQDSRALHRGAVEVLAARPALLPSFAPTDEAARLARADLRAFLARCGTHYVSQVLSRRGVSFEYEVRDGPGTPRIELRPIGLAPGSRFAREAPLHPRTPFAFLTGQPALVELLRDAEGGIAEAILLEPWVDLLRARGLVE